MGLFLAVVILDAGLVVGAQGLVLIPNPRDATPNIGNHTNGGREGLENAFVLRDNEKNSLTIL